MTLTVSARRTIVDIYLETKHSGYRNIYDTTKDKCFIRGINVSKDGIRKIIKKWKKYGKSLFFT